MTHALRAARLVRDLCGAFSLTPGWAIALIVEVAGLVLWAEHASDPDFYLPNPFSALIIYLLLLFVLTGWVRSAVVRANLRLVLGVVPLGALLLAEVLAKNSDERHLERRIAISEDRLLRYQYRPGADGVNSLGIRDHEYAVPKPPNVYRIALLGDSVPNDGNVPEERLFHRVLESKLNQAKLRAGPIEVINVSCEGYNTAQELRLLERVGLRYQPDFVLVAYVLNDPFIQNGGYRRVGNSFAAFRLLPLLGLARTGSSCTLFEPLYAGYGFDSVVRSSFELLKLQATLHGFAVAVAALPVVEDFQDPHCLALYDQVGETARQQGFAFIRVVDGFLGQDHRQYRKPGRHGDITHPNEAGHLRMGEFIADRLKPLIAAAK